LQATSPCDEEDYGERFPDSAFFVRGGTAFFAVHVWMALSGEWQGATASLAKNTLGWKVLGTQMPVFRARECW
jgi:hypothetical protein